MTATLIKPKVSIINKKCFTKVTCEMYERLLAITSHMVLMAVVWDVAWIRAHFSAKVEDMPSTALRVMSTTITRCE
jgi:hypothetical protein